MALITEVRNVLDSLASHGWRELLHAHGLDIDAVDLAAELNRNLSASIDRRVPGFEDFAIDGARAVTPGQPARSLLYHALASGNVQWSDARRDNELTKFPSLAQLQVVENYVYAASNVSLGELEALHGPGRLAVVVFASQYRSAGRVPHRRHADLVYSRAGVARVGTAAAKYDARARSFDPFSDVPSQIRVLPAKYDAYLAVAQPGSRALLGLGFNPEVPSSFEFTSTPEDQQLSFWVPVHKLFDGDECLRGETVTVSYESTHTNEKIRRIHKYVADALDEDPGSSAAAHGSFPFRFSDHIAQFDARTGLVNPEVHDAMVAEARVDNQPITLRKGFTLPKNVAGNNIGLFSSSAELRPNRKRALGTVGTGAQRSVPEYAHIRSAVTGSGVTDLNQRADLIEVLERDSFSALHYVDFTGDGFVVARPGGGLAGLQQVAAYSMVAPPDFFPYVDQATLMEAGMQGVWSRAPVPLSDIRLPPNLNTHPELIFQGMTAFDPCTALLNGTTDGPDVAGPQLGGRPEVERVSYLPDGAAGVFAPGWDTSFDLFPNGETNVPILAAYGLGSPFPEDAKLCAALSSFWPAAAPDIARSFWPDALTRPTSVPMTDDELGSGPQTGWDGEHGPRIEGDHVTYKNFAYVDYTHNALENTFDFHKVRGIRASDYLDRARKYRVAKARAADKAVLISYRIDEAGTHHYRFMETSAEINRSQTHVTLQIVQDKNVQVSADNVVTVTP